MTQRKKYTNRELIDLALIDAAIWQSGLADAYRHIPDSPERKEALEMVKLYNRLRRHRLNLRQPKP